MLTNEQVLSKADVLARQVVEGDVQDNQLAFVVAHLKRHRDVAATLELLKNLEVSPFARRTHQTPGQFAGLRRWVSASLSTIADWQDAAAIVGWARRLAAYYRPAGQGRRGGRAGRGGPVGGGYRGQR